MGGGGAGDPLIGYLARRIAGSLLLLLLVLSLTFVLVHAAPGSPVDYFVGDAHGRAARAAHLTQVMGLDRPLPEQYGRWLGRAVRGDWGTSLMLGRPVSAVIAEALPASALLGLAGLFVEYLVALAGGIWAARRRGRLGDHLVRALSLALYSIPAFWLGLMAILLFAYLWPVLPASHMHAPGADRLSGAARLLDLARHLVLPAVVLGLASAGGTLRYVRNSLLEVLGQDYIRTARAAGLGERRVLWVHALRNALAPILQLLGLSLPVLLNGVLVVEVVFAWPGLGRVIFQAITTRDFPLILGTTALSAVLVIAGNLLADLLHAAADPRLRHAAGRARG